MVNLTERKEITAEGISTHSLQCMEIWGGNRRIVDAFSVPGIDAWGYSRPHEGGGEGGDIYYASLCGAGRIARFAVADVSGHGVTVSDIASKLKQLMRKYINTANQTRFARSLNREFAILAEQKLFATAVLTTYFAPTDHLIICNAGHPRPLWHQARTGVWRHLDHAIPERVDKVRNLPLGIIEPTDYVQFAVQLGRGDTVLLFTDALIEASDGEGRQLGENGLRKLVSSLDATDPAELGPGLLDALAAYRGGKPAEDDETLLVLHHNANDPPRQPLSEKIKVMGKMLGLIGA